MVSFRASWVAATALLSWAHVVHAAIKPVNITQEDYLSIPATCFSVLTQDVNCPLSLKFARRWGGGLSHIYDQESLTELCASSCSTSLTTWHRRVVGACANVRVPSSIGKLTLVAQWAQEYLEAHVTTCLADKSGNRCNSVLGSKLGINPSNQARTGSASPSVICESCFLSLMSTQLALPLAATDTRLVETYKAITSECKVTSWTVPPTPTSTAWDISVSTGGGAEPTCSGRSVAIAGQSCQQVATSNKLSTRALLEANGLAGNCFQFPSSGNVCIPSKDVCTPYTVKSGDRCGAIARASDITQTQLIAWNTELGVGCVNLENLVGDVICVSQPGGAWVNPNPTPEPTPTTFTDALPPLETMEDIMALPDPTRIGWNNSIEVAPFADDTRLDCSLYVQPPILKDWLSETFTSSCAEVAEAYNVALDDLVKWNPSLEGDCELRDDRQYCVQLDDDRASETHDRCAQYELAGPGYDCEKFVSMQGIEMNQFVTWNPVVGSECQNFKTGVSYCVGVWRFRQKGTVSTCNQFTVANDTNWANDPCGIIESKYGLAHARFVAWNPAVLSNCTGLYRNYEYCVSIPGYRPTYTTTAGSARET